MLRIAVFSCFVALALGQCTRPDGQANLDVEQALGDWNAIEIQVASPMLNSLNCLKLTLGEGSSPTDITIRASGQVAGLTVFLDGTATQAGDNSQWDVTLSTNKYSLTILSTDYTTNAVYAVCDTATGNIGGGIGSRTTSLPAAGLAAAEATLADVGVTDLKPVNWSNC